MSVGEWMHTIWTTRFKGGGLMEHMDAEDSALQAGAMVGAKAHRGKNMSGTVKEQQEASVAATGERGKDQN